MFNLKEFLGLNYFTSELDQFMMNYGKTHPKLSCSQQKEKDKYDKIFSMRDDSYQIKAKKIFWDKF